MTFFVYILECANGSFYTGYTKNLLNRVELHNNGKGSKYVRSRLPARLVYFEEYATRREAMKREALIKTFTHEMKKELVNK